MNTQELLKHNAYAFATLPEAYRNDDCLFFWEEYGKLLARPKDGQEFALGRWVAVFRGGLGWVSLDPH